MSDYEHKDPQPLRELEWLIHYFEQHSREDLAQQIFQQVKVLRHRAQDSLVDSSDVIDFKASRKQKRQGYGNGQDLE